MRVNWSKESRHQRGYGKEWDRARKLALGRDFGMCQCSKCKGMGKVATEVHHIVSMAEGKKLGWSMDRIHDLSNLESINRECHDKEHGWTKKQQIGNDGYPL